MRRRRNPDDPTLLARVKLKIVKSRSRVTVWAYDGGTEIAKATFARAPWTVQRWQKDVLMSALTEVSSAYRRKGVASLIYRTLAAHGFKIHPASAQTWQGQQLWQGGRWPGKSEAYQESHPTTWKEKVATLRTNPDDEDLLRRLTVEVDDDCAYAAGKMGRYVELRAFDGKNYAAVATLKLIGRTAHPIQVDTWPAYRRRGVMSWLLRWAETNLRCKVRDSKDLTADGRLFKQGRRRNPGDPKSLLQQLVAEFRADGGEDVERGWVLPDGRIVDLNARDEFGFPEERGTHGGVDEYFEKAGYPRPVGPEAVRDSHITFMRLTGAIRIASHDFFLFHVETIPTPAQVTTCGKIAAFHKAYREDDEDAPEPAARVYFGPRNRTTHVVPMTPGNLRRVLEALPEAPPKPKRSKSRRNPPRDVDTLEALGDECAVWAIAAATGRTVPEVRRAFLAGGDDIWLTKGGYGSGASMRQIRAVVKRLDWDHRIVGIGQALTLGNGPRAVFTQYQSDLFVRGRRRGQIGADEFDVPEGVKDDVTRSMGPAAAVQEFDRVTTIGMLVDQAKREGLSLLAVTVNVKRSRGAYTFRGHIVGYAPGRGLYDTSVRSKTAVAKILDGKPSEVITGLDYAAHGDEVPQRMRPVVLWVFFKGK